jgi:hypothetical protein
VPFGASGFFCPVKAVENLFPVLGRNPDAGIGDGQIKAVLFAEEGQVNASALRGVADCVVKQDGEKLYDTFRVRRTKGQGFFRQGNGEGQLFFGG